MDTRRLVDMLQRLKSAEEDRRVQAGKCCSTTLAANANGAIRVLDLIHDVVTADAIGDEDLIDEAPVPDGAEHWGPIRDKHGYCSGHGMWVVAAHDHTSDRRMRIAAWQSEHGFEVSGG